MPPSQLATVVDVEVLGRRTAPDAPLDVVIEVPHGATTIGDFAACERLLTSPLPSGLVDFFLVNTDQGAPELATATARALVAAVPSRTVGVIRSRIPRTFIDCNRRIDASPADFTAGNVTPGVMPWVTTEADRALLRDAYDRYVAAARATIDELAPDGVLLLLHTYAPRSVEVEVDLRIVDHLRAAYRPTEVDRWPLRPPLDIIGRTIDGADHAPRAVVAALRAALPEQVIGESATYPLHPSTLAYGRVIDHPGRALCLEVRRDLLVDEYQPFAELAIQPSRVAPLARALVTAMVGWAPARST